MLVLLPCKEVKVEGKWEGDPVLLEGKGGKKGEQRGVSRGIELEERTAELPSTETSKAQARRAA